MSGFRARLPLLAAALWWGSLTAIGLLAVPLLFANASSPAVAGALAAKLFAALNWVALGCGLLIVLLARSDGDTPSMDWAGGALLFVFGGMLLALLVQFGVAPRIMARENLRLWHGLGTALFAGQWVCALLVLWKVSGRRLDGVG